MQSLKKRQMPVMQQKTSCTERTRTSRSAKFIFTIAAATLFGIYICGPSYRNQENARQEHDGIKSVYSMKKQKEHKIKRRTFQNTQVLQDVIARSKKDESTIAKIFRQLDSEFPHESLDCRMVPMSTEVKPFSGDEDLDKSYLPNFLHPHITPFIKQLGFDDVRRYGMYDTFPIYPTDLTKAIDKLKAEGNADGLAAILKHFNSMNVEWFEGDGNSQGNLFFTYFGMYAKAVDDKQPLTPELICIAKNSYAQKILFWARSAMASLIIDDPRLISIGLSKQDRVNILQFCTESFLFKPNPDISQFEKFFNSVPHSFQKEFVDILEKYLSDVGLSLDVDFIKKQLQNPQLKEAIKSWKDSNL